MSPVAGSKPERKKLNGGSEDPPGRGKARWKAEPFSPKTARCWRRDGAAEEIAALHREGYRTEILSGDPDRARVAAIGNQLGIPPEHIFSSHSPDQKAEHIAGGEPETSLFVGDGGNDSLALDAAACSGSPATGIRAIEGKTDFVFVGRSFQAVRRLLHAANRRRRMVLMVFLVAVLYNVAAIGLCLAGLMNPLLAAVLMPLSSLVTTTLATRV